MFRLVALSALLLIADPTGAASAHDNQEESALEITREAGPNPWTHLDLLDDPGDFQFCLVADNTGGSRPGVFLDALSKAALLRPEFIMSVGDLIEGYTEDEAQLAREWDEFQAYFDGYEIPFFYVPGNHDYTNPVMAEIWRERLGRSYYHFRYHDTLFLCLNSEDDAVVTERDNRRHISAAQLDYFRQVLDENRDVRWTLLFLHKPLWVYDENDNEGFRALEDLLADRDYTVFAGHFHTYTKHERHDRRYIVLATTGGVSGLGGPDRGQFDHVTWVTMTDDGPVLANLMLDGILPEDVFTTESARLLAQLREVETSPGLRAAGGEPLSPASFRLANREDTPLRVRVRAEPQAALPEGWALNDSVSPRSMAIFRVPVPEGVDAASVSFDLETVHETPTHRPLAYEHGLNLALGAVPSLPAAPGGVKVDGDLSDWKRAEFHALEWRPVDEETGEVPTRAPGDGAKFALGRDGETLYFAIRVRDDDFAAYGPDVESWEHEYVTVRFDPRPFTNRRPILRNYDRDHSFYLTLSPRAKGDEPGIWRRPSFPEEMQVRQSVDGKGYTVELGLPIAYLVARSGRETLEGISLNVTAIDWNAATGELQSDAWQPDWHRDEAVIGAGSFLLEP